MIYRMKLWEKTFEQIKKGQKQIEIRCFDEKRRNIKAGNTIVFSKFPQVRELREGVAGICLKRNEETK